MISILEKEPISSRTWNAASPCELHQPAIEIAMNETSFSDDESPTHKWQNGDDNPGLLAASFCWETCSLMA